MKQKTRIGAMLAMAGSLLLSAGPGHAEDIQIYLQAAPDVGGSNVLFLIENSAGTNRNFCSGQGPGCETYSGRNAKTIEEIAFAMRLVADSLGGNLRTGVASQHAGGDHGGAINYPVVNLTEPGQTKVLSRVASEAGDAYQLDVGEPIDIVSETLPLPGRDHPIHAERSGQVAFVFNELMIPRWAALKDANLSLRMPTAQNVGAGQIYEVAYQITDSASDFDANDDIFSRQWSGSYKVNVIAADNQEGVYTLGGAGLLKLIQDATARPEWCGRNNLALRFETASDNNDSPLVYSYRATGAEGDRLGRTELQVEWDGNSDGVTRPSGLNKLEEMSCMGGYRVGLAGSPDDAVEDTGSGAVSSSTNKLLAGKNGNPFVAGLSNNNDYITGLRFANLGFGAGTVVSDAQLHLHVLEGSKAKISTMLGDVDSFVANGAISGAAAGSSQEVDLSKGDVSVDVTQQVQEVIDSTGWHAGAALGLRIDPVGSGRVIIHALDGGSGTPAASLLLSLASASPADFARTISRRDELKQVLSAMADGQGGGNNKLGSAYLEAGRYMLGLKPEFEDGRSHPDSFLNPDSRDFYLSPVTETNECLASHIIKISHSDAHGDNRAPAAINQVTGDSCSGDWQCMERLAAYLRDADNNVIGSTIHTHTVSFAGDSGGQSITDEMEAVALAGGGMFRQASDAMELADVIRELLDRITVSDASMAAPGVAVNQLNRFEHLDQLYYALFRPSFSSRWDGNLKRYQLDFNASPPEIVDEKGVAAVDPESGFFKGSSNSWWGKRADGTDPDDGSDVTQGGAREELAYREEGRRLFIPKEEGSGLVLLEEGGLTSDGKKIAPERLGMPSDATEAEISRRVAFLLSSWGDPLHAEPRLVNYGFEGSFIDAISDGEKQDNVVFVATNDGALHAVDARTGKERFTFMPEEELAKTETRYSANPLDPEDPRRGSAYGLDGGITAWRRATTDGSGKASAVYLYIAQRRGGRNFYALDVSDYNNPKMMWQIKGGAGNFDNLGQTWAPPSLARVRFNGENRPVLVLAGGYSPEDHDGQGKVSNKDAMGNAIYIVDALTGKKLWSVSSNGSRDYTHNDMTMAIPAAVAVVDVNFDGITDYLYASDLGGQVFRVDLNANNSGADDLVHQVVTVASVGIQDAANSTIGDHRRFFASPVVALSQRDEKPLLQVAIGSGYRAYPLDMQTGDRIYVFDDTDALGARVEGFTPSQLIREGDLLDVTSNESPSEADFDGKRGWLIRLEDNGVKKGEKVLSTAVVVDGVLFMTSYLPESAFENACQRVIGSSRLYGVHLADGSPALRKSDGTVERSRDIVLPGLPPSPQLLTQSPDKLVVLVGTAAVDPGITIDTRPRRTRWFEVQDRTEADQVLNSVMFGSEQKPN